MRASSGTRWLRSARAARWAAVALATTQVLAACSSGVQGETASSSTTTAATDPAAESGPAAPKCGPPACERVEVAGETVSFFVATGRPEPGHELVVVDPGGPGFDPAVSSSRFETDGLPRWLRERAVFVQRERWTVDPTVLSERCWDQLAAAADRRRSGNDAPDVSCATGAELFDTPETTALAIRALVDRFHPSQVTVVGFSFGALRVAAASASPSWSSDWRVLIADPAPLADQMSGPEVLAHRVEAGGAAVEAAEAGGCRSTCSRALTELAGRLPQEVGDRSVPLTEVDVGLGLASVAGKDADGRSEVGDQIERFAAGQGDGDLGRLADEADFASGRYGDRTYSRGALVSLLGTCLAYGGWSASSPQSSDGTRRFVDAVLSFYRPCRGLADARSLWPAPAIIEHSCALLNTQDPLLDRGAVDRWKEQTQAATTTDWPAHGGALFRTSDPTSACWRNP